MAVPLKLPDVGTVEGEVTVVRWLKAVGETVAAGEGLLEVETDKGVIAVEAAASGTLLAAVAQEGKPAQTDDLIAWVGAPGERVPAGGAPAAGTPAAGTPAAGTPSPGGQGAAAQPTGAQTPGGAGGGAVKVSPAVRKLAQEKGVDLAKVRGTGSGGMVTRADVLGHAAGPTRAAGAHAGRPLAGRQAIVARRVSQSHREKPVIRLTATVDMTRAVAERTKHGTRYDAMFVKASAVAIRALPVFRSYLADENVVEHPGVDVALAVAVGEDLFIPAVRGADAKPLAEIARDVQSLVEQARAHALQGAQTEGSCFLVSNLGALPVESFDAVIHPEHSAALAVGAMAPTPAAGDEGSIRVVPLLRMTLSVDHRLVNGRAAAELLSRIKAIVEEGRF